MQVAVMISSLHHFIPPTSLPFCSCRGRRKLLVQVAGHAATQNVEQLTVDENRAPLTYTSVVAQCSIKLVRAGKEVSPEGAAAMQQVMGTVAKAITAMHKQACDFVNSTRMLSGEAPCSCAPHKLSKEQPACRLLGHTAV